MFDVLGGNVVNFVSLGCFSCYNASVVPYCMYLVDENRKIMRHIFFDFFFPFLWYLLY